MDKNNFIKEIPILEGSLKIKVYNKDRIKAGVIVFFPSVRPEKYENYEAYFPRQKWASDLSEYCCVYVSDPFSYYICDPKNNSTGSWFISPQYRVNVFETVAMAIKSVIEPEKGVGPVIFYGSSMGGYAALMVACYFEPQYVFSECPQLDLNQYYASKDLASSLSDKASINVFDFINSIKPSFNFKIMMHIGDYVHLRPLLQALLKNDVESLIKSKQLNFEIELYSSVHKGHLTLERACAVKLIREKIVNLSVGQRNGFCIDESLFLEAKRDSVQLDLSILEPENEKLINDIADDISACELENKIVIDGSEVRIALRNRVFYFNGTVLAGRFSFVYLKEKEGWGFFVVQHLGSIVGFYCIHENVYFPIFSGFKVDKILKDFYSTVSSQKSDYVDYLTAVNKWGGILVNTDARPSHYFYESISPFGSKKIEKICQQGDGLFYYGGANFFPIAQLLSLSTQETVDSPTKIQAQLKKSNSFIFQAGFRAFRGYFEYIPLVDRLICNVKKSMPLEANTYDLVVWVGLCSEKRGWINQFEFFESIIPLLNSKYGKVAFLLDSLTSSVDCTNFSTLDEAKINSISERFDAFADFISLNGLTVLEKVAYGEQTDVAVTSRGTDSLVISRVVNAPTILHSGPNNSMFKKHVYGSKSVFTDVKKSWYPDESASVRDDFLSYCLDTEYVVELFLDLVSNLAE